jgi:hypothetical protein
VPTSVLFALKPLFYGIARLRPRHHCKAVLLTHPTFPASFTFTLFSHFCSKRINRFVVASGHFLFYNARMKRTKRNSLALGVLRTSRDVTHSMPGSLRCLFFINCIVACSESRSPCLQFEFYRLSAVFEVPLKNKRGGIYYLRH